MDVRAAERGRMIRNPNEIRRAILACQRKRIALRVRERDLRRDLAVAEQRMATVREMYSDGRTYREIGNLIGTTRQFVYQLVHPDVRRRREGRA